MVAAAVQASVGSTRIRSIDGIGYATSRQEPSLAATTAVVDEATAALPEPPAGPVVAEAGEFYEEPSWVVAQALEGDFKYVESIAEREVVQTAHYAAYGARDLLR